MFDHAGQIRRYNITKRERVLKGGTVTYAAWDGIDAASVKHIAKFSSDIWQIHPFAEGNTRATAVFIIKYMKTFGFRVNNEAFEKNSWYFRNALVMANHNDLQKRIHATTKFLELFFSNLLLGTQYELKNRYLHVDYIDATVQSASQETQKGKNCTLECTLEELAIIQILRDDPSITQKELASKLGKSERTIKNRIAALEKKNYIRRVNGKRCGRW